MITGNAYEKKKTMWPNRGLNSLWLAPFRFGV